MRVPRPTTNVVDLESKLHNTRLIGTSMARKKVILLVEDDLPVRKLLSEVLHGAGHEVVSASSGRDAIKAFNEHQQRIDLLVTDLNLAEGMTGVDVAEQLLSIRPGLRVLMMSGSPMEPAIPSSTHFIRKPFVPVDFVDRVHQVLTKAAGGLPVRRECDWIEHLVATRHPNICIECKEMQGNQYMLRLQLAAEAPSREVLFSVREYLDGSWEQRVEAALHALEEYDRPNRAGTSTGS